MATSLRRQHRLLTVLLLSTLSLGSPASVADQIQHLYLVRHAEKADSSKDPQLSACGKAQAAALATLLSQLDLPKLYHSGYQRTRDTAAASLQDNRSLVAYDAKDLPALAALLTSTTTDALVVGHSNTTPQLATLLSKQPVPSLGETDYGRIYQLSRAGGHWSVQLLQIPRPSACTS